MCFSVFLQDGDASYIESINVSLFRCLVHVNKRRISTLRECVLKPTLCEEMGGVNPKAIILVLGLDIVSFLINT